MVISRFMGRRRLHRTWVWPGILLTTLITGPVTANPQGDRSDRPFSVSVPTAASLLLQRAQRLTQLRIPYLFGGNDNAGMDCSRSVQRLYQDLGIVLPRNSDRQATHLARQGRLWRVAPSETERAIFQRLRPGDLVFWTRSDPNRISHVMVFINADAAGICLWGARGRGKTGMTGSGVDFFGYRPGSSGKLVAYGRPGI